MAQHERANKTKSLVAAKTISVGTSVDKIWAIKTIFGALVLTKTYWYCVNSLGPKLIFHIISAYITSFGKLTSGVQ